MVGGAALLLALALNGGGPGVELALNGGAAGLALDPLLSAAQGALPPLPGEVVYQTSRFGSVSFDHGRHLAVRVPCTSCHAELPVQRIELASAQQAHELCLGCHRTVAMGPTRCTGCHRDDGRPGQSLFASRLGSEPPPTGAPTAPSELPRGFEWPPAPGGGRTRGPDGRLAAVRAPPSPPTAPAPPRSGDHATRGPLAAAPPVTPVGPPRDAERDRGARASAAPSGPSGAAPGPVVAARGPSGDAPGPAVGSVLAGRSPANAEGAPPPPEAAAAPVRPRPASRAAIGAGYTLVAAGRSLQAGPLLAVSLRRGRLLFLQSLELGGGVEAGRTLSVVGSGTTLPLGDRWSASGAGVVGFGVQPGAVGLVPLAGLRLSTEWRPRRLPASLALSVTAAKAFGRTRAVARPDEPSTLVSFAASAWLHAREP